MFWLKKLVSFWLMPLPLCLALLFAGLLLGRRPRTQGVGRRLCCAAALLLLLLSNRAVSNRMVRPLESEYGAIPEVAPGLPAPPQIAGCAYIVVLGAGNSDMPGVPATGLLTTSALERIVEAVRLLRILPGARLLVSGNTMAGGPSHATVLARAAEALGIDPSRITMIEPARDTEDESRAVARIAGGARVGLVTSAWHMPRAARLFRAAGVNFVACPADFAGREGAHLRLSDLALDSESLVRSTLAVHEWLGLLWLCVRGVG